MPPSLPEAIAAVSDRARAFLWLSLVPLVSSLLNVDSIQRVLSARGKTLGVSLAFPPAVADVWTFVHVPARPGVYVSPLLPLIGVFLVVRGALAAGYLGSIDSMLDGTRPTFLADTRRYLAPLVGFVLLQYAVSLVFVGLGVVAGPLVLLGLPVVLGLTYVFFGTPYLVVVEDRGLVDGLARSLDLALSSSAYAWFGVQYLVLALVVSFVATAVVVNAGIPGIVLGALLAAPLGFVLNAATMHFFRALTGASPPAPDPAGVGHVPDRP